METVLPQAVGQDYRFRPYTTQAQMHVMEGPDQWRSNGNRK